MAKEYDGRELGIFVIEIYCNEMKQVFGKKSQKPMPDKKTFLSKLTTQKDIDIFKNYIRIQNWATWCQSTAEKRIIQIEANFRALETAVTEVMLSRGTDLKKSEILQILFIQSTLESYFAGSDTADINRSFIEKARKSIMDDCYYCLAYKYTLERIADLHDVPDITIFWDIIDENYEGVKRMLSYLNKMQENLWELILKESADSKTREKQKDVLITCFSQINFNEIDLDEEAKIKAEELIADFSAFHIPDGSEIFKKIMLERPQ